MVVSSVFPDEEGSLQTVQYEIEMSFGLAYSREHGFSFAFEGQPDGGEFGPFFIGEWLDGEYGLF